MDVGLVDGDCWFCGGWLEWDIEEDERTIDIHFEDEDGNLMKKIENVPICNDCGLRLVAESHDGPRPQVVLRPMYINRYN